MLNPDVGFSSNTLHFLNWICACRLSLLPCEANADPSLDPIPMELEQNGEAPALSIQQKTIEKNDVTGRIKCSHSGAK